MNLIFTACVVYKNPVQTRKKSSSSNSIFQTGECQKSSQFNCIIFPVYHCLLVISALSIFFILSEYGKIGSLKQRNSHLGITLCLHVHELYSFSKLFKQTRYISTFFFAKSEIKYVCENVNIRTLFLFFLLCPVTFLL